MANQLPPQLVAKFDQMFMTMTQEAGGLNPFMDTMFSFLQRRTDFYYEAEPGDRMGFPPGYSEQLVGGFYMKYKEMHEKQFPPKGDALRQRWTDYQNQQKAAAEAKKAAAAQPAPTEDSQTKTGATVEEVKTEEVKEESKTAPAQTAPQAQAAAQASSAPRATPASNPLPPRTDIDVDKTISTYNGGTTANYKWSQQMLNVDVQIKLPAGTKARQILCDIKTRHLKVMIKGQAEPLVDGELHERVKVDDSFWNVEDNEYLNINLEKMEEKIWKTVIVGDDEIDPKSVDNTKNVEDFDLETQGHLQKVLYERNRKMNGLPTTEEEANTRAINEMFKNNPSSPFAQTPYDREMYGRKDGVNAPAIPFI